MPDSLAAAGVIVYTGTIRARPRHVSSLSDTLCHRIYTRDVRVAITHTQKKNRKEGGRKTKSRDNQSPRTTFSTLVRVDPR